MLSVWARIMQIQYNVRGTNAILFYNVEVMGVTWMPLYRIAKLIYKLKHLGSMLNTKDLRVAISCCKEIKTVNLN